MCNPSATLLSFMASVAYLDDTQCKNSWRPQYETLLAAGADVNCYGCGATPLQIAVANEMLELVETLLKNGANPIAIGDLRESPWEEGTWMADFNEIRNLSPLCVSRCELPGMNAGIEEMLLGHGGEDFVRQTDMV